MAWFTSWLPSLPTINITIPAAIQRRFFSFVLKRCLGHFLKPGQLDHYQIDSQIGSGYVQVNQLELDPQAINSYIDGLPISMKGGSVAAVRAHIPWPNPLASTVGISLTSAHFIFEVISSKDPTSKPNVDLSDSVASVADSFIHQELSPKEEETLWQSFHAHPSLSVDQQLPSIPGTLGVSTSFGDDASAKFDYDPAGVSVFASLIENLLARFEFDARDIKISLVHADNICVTLSLQEATYQTDAKSNINASSDIVQGEHRTLSFSGLSLSVTQLGVGQRPLSPITIHTLDEADRNETRTPLFGSPASSGSSLDEETQAAMSQSLAALSPRPDSLNNSLVSSMYHSAFSIASPIVEEPVQENAPLPIFLPTSITFEAAAVLHSQEQTILSLGTRPITVVLTTPSPASTDREDNYSSTSEPRQEPPLEELHVTITMSTIACAIKPCHLDGLLRLNQALSPSPHNQTPRRQSVNNPRLPALKVTVTARGFVLLLDPTSYDTSASMVDFFEQPLVPPRWNYGYSRIHLETLEMSAEITTTSQRETVTSKSCIDFTVADLSIFSFTPINQESLEVKAFPLLITDRYLASQYPSQHEQPDNGMPYPTLPTFGNSDWTQERFQNAASKLSLWRGRPPKADAVSPEPYFQMRGCHTATLVGLRKVHSRIADELKISFSPLHVRIDLDHLVRPGGLLSFFDGLLPIERDLGDKQSVYSDDTVDDSPLLWRQNISDDLESPFSEPVSTHPLAAVTEATQKSGLDGDENTLQLIVGVPVLRISLRSPSPPHHPQRSGIVVADIHDLCIATGTIPAKHSARFADEDHSPTLHVDISGNSVQVNIQFQRAVFASFPIGVTSTTAFASIGSLKDNQPDQFEDQRTPLLPCIQLVKPDANKVATMMALSVDIPAIYVDISKPCMDGLQYFTDDVAQFLERMSGDTKDTDEVEGRIQDTKLIGSRFFAKSRGGSLSSSVADTAEMVVKMTLTEAFIRFGVPRRDDETKSRPFDLKALDIDLLLEINPDGKQQTVLTLGLMDFLVLDTAKDGPTQTFLSLTSPHSLTTTPKSIVKLRFSTATLPETNSRETRVKLTLCGFTYTFFPDLDWISDLTEFGKNPPGTFESVIPSDRTRVSIKIVDGSMRLFAPNHPGCLVTHVQELDFATDVVGDSCDSSFHINATSLSFLALDDCVRREPDSKRTSRGVTAWTASGYALFIEVPDIDMLVIDHLTSSPAWKIDVHRISLRLHMCADTLTAVGSIISDLGTLSESSEESMEITKPGPSVVRPSSTAESNLMSSVEDLTFKRMPEVGSAPDMINDDLPTNMYYLDGSFGPAAGLREIRDDDLDEFDTDDITAPEFSDSSVISRVGGETIKILDAKGLDIMDDYFLNIPAETDSRSSDLGDSKVSLRIFDGNFNIFLYDGYDWARTRKTIEEGVKEMRKRLAKIRQLVANGHVEEPSLDDTSTLLFNSIHIGLDDDDGALGEPAALIAAIDRELKDDEIETTSWQSLPTFTASKQPRAPPVRVHGKRLTRSRGPSVEFSLHGLRAEFDKFYHDSPLVSRTFVTVRDAEILDHIKTSTWKKFLTQLRSDSRGNVRETDSNMVRVELRSVRPVPGNSTEEARMKAKLLPLRLYVDQDAVDFLKKFFSFTDPSAPSVDSSPSQEAYIQHAEIFPVDLKLDYKPRRVDYRALKQGRTIELMNFFHFDGAEMTLRHITLSGITGWGRLFELLNDLWTPDVKATQLAEVISGVTPIRSVVNVGSGVADLILLPISQYKKDGRIVRGVQRGAKAFVKSTAIEAVKMGAKLATGTQVILEQAEGILGGNFEAPITAETVQTSPGDDFVFDNDEVDEESDLRSKYAQQPADIKEGVQFAYKSLRKNLSSAAQTILAVPMEVYERSGNEGPIRSVIRAVPIAVLKPMIGASEAISKTLQGLHNTLDPNVRHENEAKYKR